MERRNKSTEGKAGDHEEISRNLTLIIDENGKKRSGDGRTNAIMVLHVMEFNLTGNAERFSHIAQALGVWTEGLSLKESAKKVMDKVKEFLEEICIPFRLRDCSIPQDAIPSLVEGFPQNRQRSFATNPRGLRREYIKAIYNRAW